MSLLVLLIRAVYSLSNTTLEFFKKKLQLEQIKLQSKNFYHYCTVCYCMVIGSQLFQQESIFQLRLFTIHLFTYILAIHHLNSASQSGKHNRLPQSNRTSQCDQNANLKHLYHPSFVSQLRQFMLQSSAS